jgi:hypothetical protein
LAAAIAISSQATVSKIIENICKKIVLLHGVIVHPVNLELSQVIGTMPSKVTFKFFTKWYRYIPLYSATSPNHNKGCYKSYQLFHP